MTLPFRNGNPVKRITLLAETTFVSYVNGSVSFGRKCKKLWWASDLLPGKKFSGYQWGLPDQANKKVLHIAHETALQSLKKDLNVWRKFFAVSLNAMTEMYRKQRGDN